MPNEIPLARWAETIQKSVLEEMLSEASRPNVLSFALGLPAPELFPTQALNQAASHVLDTDPYALQYRPPFQPLKSHIVSLMAKRGVNCSEEQVFLTTGAQQGMSLLTRLLLNPGGSVLLEEFVYTGFQQVLESYEPEMVTVPTCLKTGMDVDRVESLLRGKFRPALIYVISAGHNPLGVCLSQEKRARLVELSQHYGVPILEDDPYGFLDYGETSSLPLRALDDNGVFYIGSFSKILAPALRVGWVIVPKSMIPKLSSLKEAADINTATFSQRTISTYLDRNQLDRHLEQLIGEYTARRNTMLRTLERSFPSTAKWEVPSHGMFVWVTLEEGVDTGKLLKSALKKEQVAFIPGQAFRIHQKPEGVNCLRLNFSYNSCDRIEEGLSRLGRLIGECRQ